MAETQRVVVSDLEFGGGRWALMNAVELEMLTALNAVVKCPACGGHGKLTVSHPTSAGVEYECGTCDGTGQRDDEDAVMMIRSCIAGVAIAHGYCVVDSDEHMDDVIELAAPAFALEAG